MTIHVLFGVADICMEKSYTAPLQTVVERKKGRAVLLNYLTDLLERQKQTAASSDAMHLLARQIGNKRTIVASVSPRHCHINYSALRRLGQH